MDSFLKADVFFVVTTVAVCIVAVGVVWALIYILRILRNVNEISGIADKEAKELSRDLGTLHARMRKRGIVGGFAALFGGWAASKKRHRS